MGDRAVIVFKEHLQGHRLRLSPCIYLHWGGSEVPELLRKWWDFTTERRGDLEYNAARFIGLCHDRYPGNLSVGVWNSPETVEEIESHGDSGVWVVDVDTGQVERPTIEDHKPQHIWE